MNNMPAELGIAVGGHCFDDLDYADDALLIVDSNERLLPVLKRFEEIAATIGMHPSWSKTKIQNLGEGAPVGPVTIGGIAVESVDEYVYISSLRSGCASSVANVRRRMGIAAGSMRSLNNLRTKNGVLPNPGWCRPQGFLRCTWLDHIKEDIA